MPRKSEVLVLQLETSEGEQAFEIRLQEDSQGLTFQCVLYERKETQGLCTAVYNLEQLHNLLRELKVVRLLSMTLRISTEISSKF